MRYVRFWKVGAPSVVYEGATSLLSASVLLENAANPILDWTSSDEKIATVVDDLATGIRAGEVVITAESTDGSTVKALCIATVQEDDGLYKVVVDEDFKGIYTLDGQKVFAMQTPKSTGNDEKVLHLMDFLGHFSSLTEVDMVVNGQKCNIVLRCVTFSGNVLHF